MTKTVDEREYLTTQEVMRLFSASKKRFYGNIKPHLHAYQFDGKKTPWYSKDEAVALQRGQSQRPFPIGGMFKDWTEYARSQGYPASTFTRTIRSDVPLPAEVASALDIPGDLLFLERGRITFINNSPICSWETYYPMQFFDEDALKRIKQGTLDDIVEHIKECHGVVIGIARDRHKARAATLFEQELLQLKSDDPVLILYRKSCTQDRQTLVLVQRMTLLENWFASDYEYPVGNWG